MADSCKSNDVAVVRAPCLGREIQACHSSSSSCARGIVLKTTCHRYCSRTPTEPWRTSTEWGEMLIEKPRIPIGDILLCGWWPEFLKILFYRAKGYRIGKG